MIKLSVIVPIYNQEKHLKQCIDSILNQTFHDFELILVDDGSTDESANICSYYAQRDNRIKILKKENGGLPSARNAGLQVGRGEYFVFVDSDDMCEEHMFEKMLEVAERNNVPLVVCNGTYLSGDSRKPILCGGKQSATILTSHQMIEEVLYSNDGNTVLFAVAWNKLYRHDIIQGMKFNEDILKHEDEEFVTRLFVKRFNLVMIPDALYIYRMNDNSIMHTPFNKKDCCIFEVLASRVSEFENAGLCRAAKQTATNYVEIYIDYYFKAEKKNHTEWVKDYYSQYRKMLKKLDMKKYSKKYIRLKLFEYFPYLYKVIIEVKRRLN